MITSVPTFTLCQGISHRHENLSSNIYLMDRSAFENLLRNPISVYSVYMIYLFLSIIFKPFISFIQVYYLYKTCVLCLCLPLIFSPVVNPLNPKLNPICYLLALLGAHHFLHVSRIRVKSLTFRLLLSYIYIWSTHS